MRALAPSPTWAEELANAITHGIGLLLSLIGLVVLLAAATATGQIGLVTGCAIFGGTLVFMYLSSTLYHAWRTPLVKRILRVVDHVAIYLLIAGTYTPFLLAFFTPGWRLTLLSLLWGLALAGAVYKIFFLGRFPRFSTGLYLAMGWIAVLAAKPMLTAMPAGCLLWIAGGGLAYTLGVVFYVWDRLPYNHAIWHLFVLAGSACHYAAVALYVAQG